MYRLALKYLVEWKSRPNRKPLVVRGAMQVGKSFIVQKLSKECFANLVEINFEQMPDVASLFASKVPQTILPLLEARFNAPVEPGKTLPFLDEIQATPEVFAALRYFHEQLPGLHVITAGSLLEFVLREHSFSMPVGRIEYLHLGPMTFEEFLLTAGPATRLRFWRDPDGPEVDWVIDEEGRYTPIEVKWTETPSAGDTRHLHCFLNEYPTAKQGYVICRTPRRVHLGGNILAIPWQEIASVWEEG